MQNPEEKTEDQQSSDNTLDAAQTSTSGKLSDKTEVDNDYLKLRHLILGEDYSNAIKRVITKEEDVERIVNALPEALKKSSQADLSEALAPVLDQAMGKSIEQNPSRITNILFPIMGPAIRKAVSSALAEMVQSLNTLLEQSLSFGSLWWRIKAWRAGMPYANYVLLQTTQYRVEQVLLVHRNTGLLLNSFTASEVDAQDPELVSSMLTAISDFVSDSFSDGKETLERIRFGDLELHLYVGPEAVLAIAVRGSAPAELLSVAHTVIEEIHADYRVALTHFEGDRDGFETTGPILSKCLLSQKIAHKTKRKPWLAAILILGFIAYIIIQSINRWQLNQQFEQLEASINNQAGYVIISSRREDNQLYVKALRSSESASADSLESSLSSQGQLGLNIDATLVHFGALAEPVKKEVIKEKTREEVFQTLVNKLQNTVFYFEAGEVSLSKTELLKIPSLIKNIETLDALLGEQNLQIILMGFADGSGSSIINNKVSRQRADEIKSLLTTNKVSSDIIVTWGVGHIDKDLITESLQRRVMVQALGQLNTVQPLVQSADKDTNMQLKQLQEQL